MRGDYSGGKNNIIFCKIGKKNSKTRDRTEDLPGMSRALSPAELSCHFFLEIYFWLPAQLVYLTRFVKPHRVSYLAISF